MGKPGKKPRKADWVRTAGFVGDSSMEDMEEWNRNGGGVSDRVKDVGANPNAEFEDRKNRPGVE